MARFTSETRSGLTIVPDMPICQQDLPLDWYQDEFRPYAEEYLALPDRLPETVLPWMDRYIEPALDHFGPSLMLLAHYYMGGEIVKLVERYGGRIADSYELALQTVERPDVRVFVESAVHFMAESIAILASADQTVWITNPKSGCTMEMMAKDWMIEPVFDELESRYGDDFLMIAYMNTSGRVKALAGRTGGSVCTSGNAESVVRWALRQGKRIFFVPDRHLGEVVAGWAGIPRDAQFVWSEPTVRRTLADFSTTELARLDAAQMILWGSYCGVHTVFRPEHVRHWQEEGFRVLVHPECPKPVVDAADGAGSTKYLWNEVMQAPSGSRLAIATEGHFVRNAREQGALRGVEIVNVADAPGMNARGCGCATMSRNDPPHLVAILDLLRRGTPPDLNRVLPGDVVDEATGRRERLSTAERDEMVIHAKSALTRMIEITRAA
jgi:quinolinate synthase